MDQCIELSELKRVSRVLFSKYIEESHSKDFWERFRSWSGFLSGASLDDSESRIAVMTSIRSQDEKFFDLPEMEELRMITHFAHFDVEKMVDFSQIVFAECILNLDCPFHGLPGFTISEQEECAFRFISVYLYSIMDGKPLAEFDHQAVGVPDRMVTALKTCFPDNEWIINPMLSRFDEWFSSRKIAVPTDMRYAYILSYLAYGIAIVRGNIEWSNAP